MLSMSRFVCGTSPVVNDLPRRPADARRWLKGKRVTVMGLGTAGGGLFSVLFLHAHGAQVVCTDLRSMEEFGSLLEKIPSDVELHLGGHRMEDFTRTDLVVASPAVPPCSEFLQAAGEHGVPVVIPVMLFFLWTDCRVVGVTGTLGKTTITALAGHLLDGRVEGRVWVGGNIGRNPLEFVFDVTSDDVAVLELSSFQLEYLDGMKVSPEVAVVTSVVPDHMDRYRSFEEYVEAKKALVRYQDRGDVTFLDASCRVLDDWPTECGGKALTYGTPDADIALKGDLVVERETDAVLADVSALPLAGGHNRRNAAAAVAVAAHFGVDVGHIQSRLASFRGVPHRLEYVGSVGGVRCYNDSSATTPHAAAAGIKSFGRPLGVIAGGSGKGLDMSPLVDACLERADVVVLIGEDRQRLQEMFRGRDSRYASACVVCADTLEEAVKAALERLDGGVLLLSPGRASFDMFSSYRERGDLFRALVARMGEGGVR